MLAVIARLNAKQGLEAELERLLSELGEKVRANEPGCKLYQLCKTNTPGRYVMLERYVDESALAAHGSSEHFRASVKPLGAVLEGRPEIEILTELE